LIHLLAVSPGGDDALDGTLAFIVVAGLAVICVFLFRSMNKQFKKLGPPPPPQDGE
jgi:hypothetical protein